MSTCRIHNVRFYNLEPKAVTCLCYGQDNKKLALSRDDNTIEIWHVENAPFILATIPGNADYSIEAILWIGSRLFSTGLRGMIVEYDLIKLASKYEVAVTGGAAWCMDVNRSKTRMAIGTEDGYINTFFITPDSLLYERIFDKQKGRILCLKWDNSGDMIFTGSSDTVRVWNSTTGHAIHKMTTSRKEAKKETIVWCLEVTDENTIVSGDSRGVICIWDPNIGTLIESYESHTADILALTMSNDMNMFYCAGVDPVIRIFSKVISKGRTQWVRGTERRLHVHDVRAVIEANGKLYSAGVDGYLAQSSYPPKFLVKYPPLLQPPCVTVCKKSRCILLRYSNFLELWRLGESKISDFVPVGTLHQLTEEPVKLLTLKTKDDENIVTCAVNKTSKIIVYSTDSHLRIFNFDVVDGNASLCRNDTDIPLNKVQKILFSPDSKRIVTIDNDGKNTVRFYDIEKKSRLRYFGEFQTDSEFIHRVGLVCFSPDKKYLICNDESRIVIYHVDGDLTRESLKPWSLPKYSCPVTAMAVQEDTLNLVVVYADHKIIEYSISSRKYTEFSKSLQDCLPLQWLSRPFPITNIIFSPKNENVIIMHDDTSVFVLNKKNELPNNKVKIAKLENGDSRDDSNSGLGTQSHHMFQIVKKYKHLVHLDWLNDEEMVAVEVNPISLTEKLPPTLKQKSFGM
ncbi:U3 small nucleolar RNA-associated protein 4 homolog [Leptopilina heterotoma]|uniref:U3 small nucleolar RNA-associated protein 4 homolog n=1 Tax=Leptopilina heterotoma TaxID=63436 RepID=UPI001CA92D62|nr:U3 small nucleolar RNA-associated protein 4 homolog [Leptopilina heterotoma]